MAGEITIFPGVRVEGQAPKERKIGMALKRNLQIVWRETTSSDPGKQLGMDRRFIARSLDGGPGWGVWDRRNQRFLKDREVAKRSEDEIREPLNPS